MPWQYEDRFRQRFARRQILICLRLDDRILGPQELTRSTLIGADDDDGNVLLHFRDAYQNTGRPVALLVTEQTWFNDYHFLWLIWSCQRTRLTMTSIIKRTPTSHIIHRFCLCIFRTTTYTFSSLPVAVRFSLSLVTCLGILRS